MTATLIPDLDAARARFWRNRRLTEFAQDYPGTLGRAIRRKREAMGISQRELSRRCGANVNYIQELESGDVTAAVDYMPALISLLQLTISDLRAETTTTYTEQDEVAA